jgi:hypothetical protein
MTVQVLHRALLRLGAAGWSRELMTWQPGGLSSTPAEKVQMPTETAKDIRAIFREGSKIDAAIRRAARNALLAHKREGLPVPAWKDGQVVWIPPEEIVVPDEEPE